MNKICEKIMKKTVFILVLLTLSASSFGAETLIKWVRISDATGMLYVKPEGPTENPAGCSATDFYAFHLGSSVRDEMYSALLVAGISQVPVTIQLHNDKCERSRPVVKLLDISF